MEDVEKLMRASDLAERAATLVGHAKNLAWWASLPFMPGSQFLATAAASVEDAATALDVSDADTRPQAAGALLRACVKLRTAADDAGSEHLAEECTDVVDEAAEVMRLASEYREVLALQPGRGWLRRFGSWCISRPLRRRATSGEHQVDSVGFALSGAINLLPYMGRAGVLKDTTAYSEAYLWWVSVLFSSVWGTLAVGLHAQDAGGRWLVVEFGRLCRYAATLGITILVFYFCSWMLTPASSTMLAILFAIFSAIHASLWILSVCCRQRR